jgi:hypothetical protein
MENITSLAQYGLAGVCIALIVLLAFVLKCVFDNLTRSAEIQQKLVDIVNMDSERTRENTAVLRELKEQLIQCNAAK